MTFLAAWHGDDVVGCGAVRAMPAEPGTDGRPYGEIKRMFVSPARRGERIGERILAALETVLHAQGIDRALLETGEELAPARRACTALRLRRARRRTAAIRTSGVVALPGEAMEDGLSLRRPTSRCSACPNGSRSTSAALDARWKQLQGAAHPDRFATETAAAQRVAMQWAIRINEAYRRLKDPLARAAYLCALHGADVEAESNTAMPAAFLMQQMEWRDALSEATHAGRRRRAVRRGRPPRATPR